MKVSGKGIVSGLAFEFTPSAIFGSSVAFASATTLALPPFGAVPLCAGVGAFAVSWLVLRRFGAGSKSHSLANFDQSDLERELEKLAEEMRGAEPLAEGSADDSEPDELILEDELVSAAEDELVLDDPLPSPQEDSRVIRLFDPRTQTAGELQERIDHHLRTTTRPPLSDATQELHEALSALRQSLR
jgi:hypothetical protein